MEILYAILGAIGIFAISTVITIVIAAIFGNKSFKSIYNKNINSHNTIKKILKFIFFIVMTILTVNMLKQDINTSYFWTGCILVFMYVCKFYWTFIDDLIGHKYKNNTGNF